MREVKLLTLFFDMPVTAYGRTLITCEVINTKPVTISLDWWPTVPGEWTKTYAMRRLRSARSYFFFDTTGRISVNALRKILDSGNYKTTEPKFFRRAREFM